MFTRPFNIERSQANRNGILACLDVNLFQHFITSLPYWTLWNSFRFTSQVSPQMSNKWSAQTWNKSHELRDEVSPRIIAASHNGPNQFTQISSWKPRGPEINCLHSKSSEKKTYFVKICYFRSNVISVELKCFTWEYIYKRMKANVVPFGTKRNHQRSHHWLIVVRHEHKHMFASMEKGKLLILSFERSERERERISGSERK